MMLKRRRELFLQLFMTPSEIEVVLIVTLSNKDSKPFFMKLDTDRQNILNEIKGMQSELIFASTQGLTRWLRRVRERAKINRMALVTMLEYIALLMLLRLFIGKQRREKLLADGTINIDDLMAKHFMNGPFGFIIPLNRNEFLTFFDGLKLLVPRHGGWVDEEVRSVYLKPKRGDVVLDVGASYGFYTLMASRLVGKEGFVAAFEPSNSSYRGLLANLQLNRTVVKNVKPFKIALGDFDGETKFWGFSTVFQKGESFELVPLKMLDTVVDELKLNRVSLIKIDVEGTELKVLKGALKTIKKHKPKLTIAAYHYPHESAEVMEWLNENAPFYHLARTSSHFVHAVCLGQNRF